jgi:TPR repeat protein
MKTRLAILIAMTLLATGGLIQPVQSGEIDSRAALLWQQAHQMSSNGQAFPLLLDAAKLGHPRAQSALGSIYWHGEWNIAENDALAVYWFAQSAAQGNRSAQFNLAGMYTMGQGGLSVDKFKAAELLTASATQGFAPAQSALGTCYEFGDGVPRSRQLATYWLEQAGGQGDQTAATMARFLKDPRTPPFQTQAQLGRYILAQQRVTSSPTGPPCVANTNWSPSAHSSSAPMLLCR